MDSPVYYVSAQAVAIPTLSLLAILLCVPPLVWHSMNRNLPASSLISWFLISDGINVVNALIWPTDDIDSWWSGAGLCDVEVKLMVGSYVGLPGALACIFRNLAEVMDTDRATLVPTRAQRARTLVIELTGCVGLPLLSMIMHYIVQPNRYIISTISGCVTSFDESWPSIVLSYLWLLILCLIAGAYCVLVLIRLVKYRTQFAMIFNSSGSGVSQTRFMRLFLMSFIMIVAIIPVQMYVLYMNVKVDLPLHPYSWSQVHGPEWGTILKYPTGGTASFDRWIPIAGSFVLFLSFGFGHDAVLTYRTLLVKLGLGHCFPSLTRPRVRTGRSGSWYGGLLSKVSNRTKSMFSWASSIVPKSTRLSSASTEAFTASSEKDIPLYPLHNHSCNCDRKSAGSECPRPVDGVIAVTREVRQASERRV